jgi:hypothetical protein
MTATLGAPTLAGFQAFLAGIGVPSIALPTNSPYTAQAFNMALDWVNLDIQTVSPDLYTTSVYNFATDRLFNIAQDQPGQTFFADQRKTYKITLFQAGVVQASSDEATSQTLAVPDWTETLSLMDLSNLKTPWGQQYLQVAQQTGPLWGLT